MPGSPEMQAIYFKILEKLAQPNATSETVARALQEVDDQTAAIISANPPRDDPRNDPLSEVWNLWIALMEQLIPLTPPIHQSKLVEFVVELQKKQVIVPATGKIDTVLGEALWTELPFLSLELDEQWMSGSMSYSFLNIYHIQS